MTPHSHALTMENQADMLAEYLRKHGVTTLRGDTRKAIRRTIETLNMILEGDIRSPQDMAAEAEGRVSG